MAVAPVTLGEKAMIGLLQEAAEILQAHDSESAQKVAADLLALIDGAAVVVALTDQEARATVRSTNLLESALSNTLAQLHLRPGGISPLVTAAMKIELAMIQEGLAR